MYNKLYFWVSPLSFFGLGKKTARIGLFIADTAMVLVLLEGVHGARPQAKKVFRWQITGDSNWDGGVDQARATLANLGLKNLPCYCVIDENNYQLFLLEKAKVPEHELTAAMRWRVNDLIAYDCEQALVDVFDHPEKEQCYTVVAKNSYIDRVVELVSRIGLNLRKIDIAELSLKNICEYYPGDDLALVFADNDKGKLLILKNKKIYFLRRFSAHRERDAYVNIVLEVQRSIDYYERQMGQVPPPDIVFYGNFSGDFLVEVESSFSQNVDFFKLGSLEMDFLIDDDACFDEPFMLAVGCALHREEG